jgi:hypothetical protein
MVLLNATALLVYVLSTTVPSGALLGLLAGSRIGLAALLSYGWVLLAMAYGELSLDPLFGSRDREQITALVPVRAQEVNETAAAAEPYVRSEGIEVEELEEGKPREPGQPERLTVQEGKKEQSRRARRRRALAEKRAREGSSSR